MDALIPLIARDQALGRRVCLLSTEKSCASGKDSSHGLAFIRDLKGSSTR